MTNPQLKKLAASMDKSPAFKSFVEQNATPYGLRLLEKYRQQESRRSRWTHRLLTMLGCILALLVCLSFVVLGWGIFFACPNC